VTGPPPTYLELRVGARLAVVRVLNDLLDVALRALDLGEAVRHDVTLGVAELVANVCEHEYAGRDGEVAVRLDALAGELRLTVESDGEGFDLAGAIARAAAHDPLDDIEGATDGGRGLLLLAGLFDEVRLDRERGRNRIVLRKARGP
jgi:anti-sigma regulatory factor (Ser/Thr protein kinase)